MSDVSITGGLLGWRYGERAGRRLGCALLVAAAALLAGCHDNLSAATAADGNTCYRLPGGAPLKKVVLSGDDENLETCAMHMEGYRLMHGQAAATGLYESHFIYVTPQGITASAGEHDIRYSVYTRAEQTDLDGKLHQLIAQDKAKKTPGAPNAGGANAGNAGGANAGGANTSAD